MFRLDLLEDPLKQFKLWYDEAVRKKVHDPPAMTLATANSKARPTARTVLYKGITKGGFLIFTNYHSRKAIDLSENLMRHGYFIGQKFISKYVGKGMLKN